MSTCTITDSSTPSRLGRALPTTASSWYRSSKSKCINDLRRIISIGPSQQLSVVARLYRLILHCCIQIDDSQGERDGSDIGKPRMSQECHELVWRRKGADCSRQARRRPS